MTVDHTINIIEVQNVSFSYGHGEETLKDINLVIHKGDYIGLIGPNGAGKTTLFKVILGLLKPSRGTIRLFGEDSRMFKEWPRIGYVPQKAVSFDVNFPATVGEVVLMGRYGRRGLFHYCNSADRHLAQAALEQVEMWNNRDRLIGDLSGGQQQRVFIARALVSQPEVIFLDEPSIAIDAKSRADFFNLLRKLNQELQITLVLVSHDIEVVTRETMHIACIDKTLVYHGTAQDYLQDSHSEHLFGEEVKFITAHRHDHS